MASLNEVSDSTDWLNTPVASLGVVEAGLRCHICKDFFDAPVITACSHTYCSACIRRSLSAVNAEKKCPLCWSPFDETKLRKNTIVEELARAFQTARADILELGRRSSRNNKSEEVQKDRKRKLEESVNDIDSPSPRKTRSWRRKSEAQSPVSPEHEEIPDVEGTEDEEFQPDDGLAACPICQERMPEAQVFTHLDVHQIGQKAKSVNQTTSLGLSTFPSRLQTSTAAMKPLPTLTYHLLSETQLRKKLGELGIPSSGPKKTMIRRHAEWRNLVNANCDSSRPKSKHELLQELKEWEKVQESRPANGTWKPNKASTIMEKDFNRSAWSENHSADFQSLIAQARSRAKKATNKNSSEPRDVNDTYEPKASLKNNMASELVEFNQVLEASHSSSPHAAEALQFEPFDETNSLTEKPGIVKS